MAELQVKSAIKTRINRSKIKKKRIVIKTMKMHEKKKHTASKLTDFPFSASMSTIVPDRSI